MTRDRFILGVAATIVGLAGLALATHEQTSVGAGAPKVDILDPLVIERSDPYDPSSATVYLP